MNFTSNFLAIFHKITGYPSTQDTNYRNSLHTVLRVVIKRFMHYLFVIYMDAVKQAVVAFHGVTSPTRDGI
jgi:hypothetical protein